VKNLLPARTNLQAEALVYPAIAVNWWQPSYYLADYQASEKAGVESLQFDVRQYIRNCPSKHIILAGFSQGADVVGDTFLSLSPDEATHIAAVIMYGDPKFNPAKSQSRVNQGNYSSTWAGIEAPATGLRVIPKKPQDWQPYVHSYCNKGDVVCNYNAPNTASCLTASEVFCTHLQYPQLGRTYDGAKWAVDRWKKVR
jgi:Cutinase